jgi:hypothetical protein
MTIPLKPLDAGLVKGDNLRPLLQPLKVLLPHSPLQEVQEADKDKVGIGNWFTSAKHINLLIPK